ncbi:MAG: tyrosine-type recombinase/integrase [Mycobacterium leprae]
MASIARRPDGRWRARYRDDASKEHARHFTRKVDAQRWLDEVTASIVTGQYVDPHAGRMTLRDYAEQWRAAQVHRPSSAAHVETMLRRHVYPTLGDKPLSATRPSDVQAWVKRLSTVLAPSTVQVVHGILASVFKAAIRDRRVVSSPCEGTKLPRQVRPNVEPLGLDVVEALANAVPEPLRGIVVLGAGTGLRQGEMFGLTVDRVDFLHRTLTVDRQLVTVANEEPYLGPPKTVAWYRTVPLPSVVLDALAEHLERFPASTVALAWFHHGKAEQIAARLLFTDDGQPWHRSAFGHVWRRVVKTLAPGTGLHDLRHFYASLLIRHNESVKTVQARLGHATAAETLDTYSHLWPDSDDRTRDAVDSVLARSSRPADSLRTRLIQ